MAAAIVLVAAPTAVRIPASFRMSDQAIIGCMIAANITPSILHADRICDIPAHSP